MHDAERILPATQLSSSPAVVFVVLVSLLDTRYYTIVGGRGGGVMKLVEAVEKQLTSVRAL